MGELMYAGRGCICLAVFRPNAHLLRIQIESIRDQTVGEWICIVGIDGADPGAAALVAEAIGEDRRFSVMEYADNVGFYRNFERILESVPGDVAWVALADQDDQWFSDKVERLVPLLDGASLAAGQALILRIGAETAGDVPKTRRRVTGLTAMLVDNQVTGSLSVFRRDLLDVALPFPPATDAAFHDHWLAICALVSDGISMTDEAVQNYVQHASNVIGEEGSSSLGRRLDRLSSTSAGAHQSRLDYIAEHRWGWRAGMAQTALKRQRRLRADDRRVLVQFASNRLSFDLVVSIGGAVIRREAPPLRAATAIVGAYRNGLRS